MKTKHILTALALPTMFAACTADDIVSENNAMQQAERAKLSKDFVLNTNNEIDSRYAVEGTTGLNFVFEEGDLIGANLIDAFAHRTQNADGTAFTKAWDKEDPATWEIVGYVAPALPFENVGDDTWKSAGQLGIGNYLFTNPYNPADMNRAAAKYELPIVIQYSSENPNAHIEAYNKAVAATVLRKDDVEANISLKNIYTYPKIRVNFDKNDEVTKVTKVILKRNGEFIYQGAFNHAAIVDMFDEEKIEAWLEKTENKDKTVADYWAEQNTEDFVIDTQEEKAAAANYATVKTNPTIVYEMNEKVVSNSFEVRLMLPSIESLLDLEGESDYLPETESDDETATAAEEATLNPEVIVMYICTDKGNYKYVLTDHTNYEFKSTTLAAQKDKALWRNKSNTLTVKAGKLAVASKDEIDGLLVANIVSTVADWNKLVDEYGDLKKYSAAYKAEMAAGKVDDAKELVVTIVGDEFALTSDLKMPEVAEFVIKSNVAVSGDVTLKNVKVEGTDVVVTVKEGSALTADQTFSAPAVKVEKGAELIFTAAYNTKKELIAYTGITTVNNEGTVTVPAGVEATFALNNLKKEAILNVGTAARAAAEAKANLSGYNFGIINNYGVTTVAGAFENKAATKDAGYTQDKKTLLWDAQPTILNEGTFNVKSTMTNNGVFNNNKELSSNFNGGTFTNAATLNVKAGASTYIDANATFKADNTVDKQGTIVLSEKNPVDFTIHGAKGNANYGVAKAGIIKYTATKAELASLDLSTSPATYVIANGDVNLVKTFTYTAEGATSATVKALNTLEVNGGDVKIAGSTATAGAPAKVTNLKIASGKAAISSVINSVSNIYVAENASLEIIEGAGELKISSISNVTFGTVVKEGDKVGILEVNGKMSTDDETADSKVLTTSTTNILLGKGVEILGKSNVATNKAAAMKNAVELWASQWYGLKSELGDIYYNNNPYDVAAFITTMTRWDEKASAGSTFKKAADDVKTNFGIDGTTGKTWKDKMFGTDKVTPISDFTSAVTTFLGTITDGTKTGAALATKTFIDATTGEFEIEPFSANYHNATYFETQAETYDVVRLALAGKEVTDNASAQKAATAWLLTEAQITTAMSKNAESIYWFVWENCDMEALVDLWIYYSPQVKGDNCNYGAANRDGKSVVTWAKHVKSLVTPAGIAKEAQEALASYTYQDLDKKYAGFDVNQVKSLCEKGEYTSTVSVPNN